MKLFSRKNIINIAIFGLLITIFVLTIINYDKSKTENYYNPRYRKLKKLGKEEKGGKTKVQYLGQYSPKAATEEQSYIKLLKKNPEILNKKATSLTSGQIKYADDIKIQMK